MHAELWVRRGRHRLTAAPGQAALVTGWLALQLPRRTRLAAAAKGEGLAGAVQLVQDLWGPGGRGGVAG